MQLDILNMSDIEDNDIIEGDNIDEINEVVETDDNITDEINIINNFNNFLTSHQVFGEGVPYTHTRFAPPFGKYNILDNEYDKFINMYKKVLGKIDLHLTEKQKDVGPILIDIDYRQDKKYKERKYLEKHIEKLVTIATNMIRKYFKVTRRELEAFVWEKEKPTYDEKQNNYKDGFHIIYPIPVDVKMRFFLREKIKEAAEEMELFEDVPYTEDTTYDNIFDIAVVKRNGWLMYGSKKASGNIYALTHIYNADIRREKLSKYSDDELVIHMAIRKFSNEEALINRESEDADKINKEIHEIYNKYNGQKKVKPSSGNKDNNEKKGKNAESQKNNLKDKIERATAGFASKEIDIAMAKKLVNILSKQRATEWQDWIHVGWALHNIDDSLLEDFIKFSKKAPKKYQEGCCEKVWGKARNEGLTISSLHWWARKDNLKEYVKILRGSINDLIKKAETGSHADIAMIVYEMYKHSYKCVSIKKNIWFEFQGHKWVKIDSAYTLANKISDELSKEFAGSANLYFQEMMGDGGIEKDGAFERAKKVSKIIDKVKNEGFIGCVLSAGARRFYDPHFEEKLDDNKDLIGFNNGVYDLKAGCFRDGLPDDYVTMSVGYDYKDFKDLPNDPNLLGVKDYFNKVMMDPEMRKYVLTLIASYMDGHARNQKFILWTGSGCHAAGTPIVMHDGSIKRVEHVQLNDQIMGDDGAPRLVKVLFTGEQDMHTIHLDNGVKFTVNANHRLALRSHYKTNIYETLDIYDELGYAAEWDEYFEEVPMRMSQIFKTKEEAEKFIVEQRNTNENFIDYGETIAVSVIDYLNLKDNIKNDYKIYIEKVQRKVNNKPEQSCHTANKAWHNYVLNNNYTETGKALIKADLETRLKYVANIIDKYGSVDKILGKYKIPKNIFTNSNAEYIIRSVGIRVDIDNDNIYLSGSNIDEIPVRRIEQLDKNNKNAMDFDYAITKVENNGKGRFYGFELDGNKKYIMGNGIVSYNSNGKSATVNLVQYTLGDYFGVLPTTVLTRKEGNSSNATPELADKRGKRLLVIQEPEHNDTVYVGRMKNLTGGDWIQARALYGDPFMYKPQFKLMLTCNRLPHIPATDGGTWRRLRVTPWESMFIDGIPKKKNEYKKDPELDDKMKEWKQAFIWWILKDYYADYRKNGMTEPAKVTSHTDKYKKDSDVYYEFLSDQFIITGANKDKVSQQSIYDSFKGWYRNGNNTSPPDKKEFMNYILGVDKLKVINGYIVGIKVKVIIDEKEDKDDAKNDDVADDAV
jgi:P4 family phage/plasmid primase-like protien